MPKVSNSLNERIFSDIHVIPEFLQKKHLPSLDGLRCFSILIVIIAHVNYHHPEFRNKILLFLFGAGQFGVQFFFVLSGFIITTLLLTERVRSGAISLRHFYLRRILRIFPLAYLYLLTLIFLNILFQLNIGVNPFLASFLFIKNFDFTSFSNWYVNHYWSLGVEEQYYLIFPFILTKGMNVYLRACFTFLFLFVFINIAMHFYPIANPVINMIVNTVFSTGTVSILIGSLTAIFLFKMGARLPDINETLLNVLVLFLFVIAFITFYNPRLFGIVSLLCGLSVGAIILLIVRYPYGIAYHILNNKLIAYIGKLSFSLYVWQQIFTAHQPWKDSFKYGGSVLLNILLLFIVAYLSYNYFEKPFLRLKDRFREV